MNRKLITAAATALAVVALSGCGSSGDDAKPSPGGAVDGQAVATKMVEAMTASKTTHVTLASQGKQLSEGDIELTDPGKMAIKVSLGEVAMEVVQVEGVTYLKGYPGTKKWVKVDPKGVLSTLGDLSKRSNPKVMVSMMEGVRGKAIGTEQVGGVSTQHYAFEIPVSAFGKAFGPEAQKLVTKPLAVDFWVGVDNLPRKINLVVEGGVKTQSTLTYSDWGKSMSIVAPPAAELGTLPGL